MPILPGHLQYGDSCHQNNVESVTTVARGMCVCVWGGGGGRGVEILQMGAKIKTPENP